MGVSGVWGLLFGVLALRLLGCKRRVWLQAWAPGCASDRGFLLQRFSVQGLGALQVEATFVVRIPDYKLVGICTLLNP